MQYSCPVCSSSAVETAGATDLYVSLICRDCLSWSTVPLPPQADAPPGAVKRPPRG